MVARRLADADPGDGAPREQVATTTWQAIATTQFASPPATLGPHLAERSAARAGEAGVARAIGMSAAAASSSGAGRARAPSGRDRGRR